MTTPSRQHLYEKPSRYAALMEAAVDAIIVIDQYGRIEEFNPAAQRMFGYDADEVLGHNVSILMPAQYAGDHDRYLQHYNSTGEARIIGIGREVQARRQDGSVFPIDLSVGEAREGGERFFVGIIRDISEREEARELRQRLAHLTRLCTLGEMASGIAHEMNQPLAAITTYAQAARRLQERGDTAELDEVLDKIARQAERAAAIIRQMRGFVQRQVCEQELVQANDLVNGVIQFLQMDSGRRSISIRCDVTPDLPALLVGRVQIQQVLLNLLLNAVDATEAASTRESVCLRVLNGESGQILFRVEDRGCGVLPEDAARLFTPFFTTKLTGMGMGLPICRSIVQAHGGQLDYHPHPDGGSIFEFSIPAMTE